MDNDILLDFITHPGWDSVNKLLADLVAELTTRAARTQHDHKTERGRLLGAERAAMIIDQWRTNMKKELRKSG